MLAGVRGWGRPTGTAGVKPCDAIRMPGNRVSRRKVLLGAAAVGGFLAVDLGSLAWARGWVGSERLTPAAFLAALRGKNTPPGFRSNHAKGVVVSGFFDGTGAAGEISSATVLRRGRTPVEGRFSLGGSDPTAADTADNVRGLGLAFGFPGTEQWRTAMINLPVFPVNSPQGFFDRLAASAVVPETGKPDPATMARFQADHPETVAATAVLKATPPTSGFADSTFHGLNAFFFVADGGIRTPVRWTLNPVGARPTAAARSGPNALFDTLIGQLRTTPLQWKLLVTVGRPEDPTNDASVPWPSDRQVIDAGTVTLTSAQTERPGNARDVNFDPLVLPDGIEPSDDPLLSARSAVYSASFRLRESQPVTPPAVNVDEVAL